MRDVQKLRERVQLSLDDRQVAGLAFAVLLLLAGVFALGLMVGKGLAARAPDQDRAGELAALDEEHKREKPPEPRATSPAPPKAHPEPAAKLEAASVSPPPKAPEPEKVALAVAPQPDRKPLVIDPPRPLKVAAPAAHPKNAAPPREAGDFTVQIGASQEKSEAQRLEARARSAGLKPYLVEADLGAKGTWYRVRVGSFRDKLAAARFKADVERELRVSAAVMPAR